MTLPNYDNPTNHISSFTSAIAYDDVVIRPRVLLKRRYISGGNDTYDANWSSITSYLLKDGLGDITWGIDDQDYVTGLTKNANIDLLVDNSERAFAKRTSTDSLWYNSSTAYYLENSLIRIDFVAALRDGTEYTDEFFSGLLKHDTMRYSLDGTKAKFTVVSKLDYLKTKHMYDIIDETRQFSIDALGLYDRAITAIKTTLPDALELTFPCMALRKNFLFDNQKDLNSNLLNYVQKVCQRTGSLFGVNRSNEVFITYYDNTDSITAAALSIPAAYTASSTRYYSFGDAASDFQGTGTFTGVIYDKAYLQTYSALSYPVNYGVGVVPGYTTTVTTGKFGSGRLFVGADGLQSGNFGFAGTTCSIELLYRYVTLCAYPIEYTHLAMNSDHTAASSSYIFSVVSGYRGKAGIGSFDTQPATPIEMYDYPLNKNWCYQVINIDNSGSLPVVVSYINGIKVASLTSQFTLGNPGFVSGAWGNNFEYDFLRVMHGNITEAQVETNTKNIFGSKSYFPAASSYTFRNTGINRNILKVYPFDNGVAKVKNRIEVYKKEPAQYILECTIPESVGSMWVIRSNGKLSVYSFTSIETSDFTLSTALKDIFANIPGFDMTQTSDLNLRITNRRDEVEARSALFQFRDSSGLNFQTATSEYTVGFGNSPYTYMVQYNSAFNYKFEDTASIQEYGIKSSKYNENESIFTSQDGLSNYAQGILDSYSQPKIKFPIDVPFLEGNVDLFDRVTVEFDRPFINKNGFIISESQDLVAVHGFDAPDAGNIDWVRKDFYIIGIRHSYSSKVSTYTLREV